MTFMIYEYLSIFAGGLASIYTPIWTHYSEHQGGKVSHMTCGLPKRRHPGVIPS